MIFRNLETPEERAKHQFNKLGGYEFHYMKLYMLNVRKMMDNQLKVIAKSRSKDLLQHPQAEQDIEEYYKKKRLDYNTNFVGLLLNSSLVTSVSLFEVMFKRVCMYADYRTRNKFDEPYQQVNENCKGYLKDIGLKVYENDSNWKKINEYIKVRNLITHHATSFKYEKNVTRVKDLDTIKHIKNSKYIFIKHPRSKRDKEF
jgi:hypothetical protein